MRTVYVASISEEVAEDSILDTAAVAMRTILEVTEYAKIHGLKVFRVTIEEVKPS